MGRTASPTHLEMLIAQSGSQIWLSLSVYNSLQILQLKNYKPHAHAAKSLSSTWLGEPTKPKHSTEIQQKNGHQMGYEKMTDSLGAVGPCTARSLFEIASGRSRGPFPHKYLLERCQLPSFFLCAGFSTTKIQMHFKSQARGPPMMGCHNYTQECLPFALRPSDGWKYCFITSNYSKRK